jgi:CRISPR-associated endonuclease/helicase Cas3
MRASALLRHLLVVDEVHCSDAYMTRLLGEVLRRQLAAGGHALLMSATLGSAARERLMRPETHPRAVAVPRFSAACDTPYPAFSHRAGTSSPTLQAVKSGANEKLVAVTLAEEIAAPRSVAERALRAATAGAAVIVLRNTVRDCLLTQRALEALAHPAGKERLLFRCENVIAPHHARFAKDDRGALDEALEQAFGKARSGCGVIAVTTQTVQQSLDLDADLLVTDLCPIDVLLQRIGRLHRHPGRPRPREFEGALAVVLVPERRDLSGCIRRDGEARGPHGLGTVYGDLRIIEATWRILLEHRTLAIPSDNRFLVESATHPMRLDALVKELGGAWSAHASWIEGVTIGDEQQAQLNLMHWGSPFLGRDEMDRKWLFPSEEMARRITTRLGEEDRLAVFEPPLSGPFGKPVGVLTLPAYWARGATADERPAVVAVNTGVIRFRFGNREFTYDRLGLRPGAPQLEDDDADA